MDCDIHRPSTLSSHPRSSASNGQLDLHAGATLDTDQAGLALHCAAVKGHVDATKLLIEKGYDVNIQDNNGCTALHHAASQGHVAIVTVLLEHGCGTDLQNEHGNAAIHEAAWNGFSKTLELLVKFDASVSIVNKAGFSALHLSAQNGHNESTRVLLYAGCDSDIKNNYGDTTLHTAARYGHAGVTRILISARAKLNEQNKNGDTALHIAAALKRRKIAKLLLQSGIDLSVRNKQNETAVDVARRKEHEDIVTLIQAFCQSTKVVRDVNVKTDVCDVERPRVTPDQDLPHKIDGKAEKGKRFLFFKKKKAKDKEKNPTSHGAVPQKSGTASSITTCEQPVQGFFSKYVPKAGVQYYRDLAGTIKQGPIGYTPTCNCLPTIPQCKRQPDDMQNKVYDQMRPVNQVRQEHHNHVNHHASAPTQALEKYAQDQLVEEEMHQRRINDRSNDRNGYYGSHGENVKSQIQNWLEQKLEGYGHCLDHHHDDLALPNENIFSEVHETANGRLFKSRSDETLSQSDNHSVRNRKRDFYESRQEAMQQIRAWQVPRYSRDRHKLKVYENQPASNRKNIELPKQSQSRNQANIDQEPTRQYPIEPKIEVRTSKKTNPQYFNEGWPDTGAGCKYDVKQCVRVDYGLNVGQSNPTYSSSRHDNSAYVTASPSERVLDRPAAHVQPQTYQCANNVTGQSGPILHSVPNSQQSHPYSGRVIGATDHCLLVNKSSTKSVPVLSDSIYNSNVVQDSFVTASADFNKGNYSTMQRNSALTQRTKQYLPVNAAVAIANYSISTSSDKVLAEQPTPTFTTFGYCDTDYGHMASINTAEQIVDVVNNSATDTPKSNTPRSNISGHSNNVDQGGKISLTGNGAYLSPRAQTNFGLTQRHPDDVYRGMVNPKLNQKTNSSAVLLEPDIECAYKSKSEECVKDFTGSFQLTNAVQSSASDLNVQSFNGCTVRNVQSPTNAIYPQNTCAPFPTQNSYTRSMTGPQVPPKPSIYIQSKSYSHASRMDVQKEHKVVSTNPQVPPKHNYNIQSKSYSHASSMDIQKSNNEISTSVLKDAYQHVDRAGNVTVKADVHSAEGCYRPSLVTGVCNTGTTHIEPRSKTAYQTYLTENPQRSNVPTENVFKREISNNVREISPNICDLRENSPNNNSKEDCSSNPDSGYGSKIYGNHLINNGSTLPTNCIGTPYSSGSPQRGLTSGTNGNHLINNGSTLPTNCIGTPYLYGSAQRGLTSGTNGNHLINNDSTLPTNCDSTPYSTGSAQRGLTSGIKNPQNHCSNASYQCLPKPKYNDLVEVQVSSWYQRKLQETTQKVYDSWRSERSPGKVNHLENGRRKFGERYYGNTDYEKIDPTGTTQNGRQNFSQVNGLQHTAQNGNVASSSVVHSSDV